MLLAASWVGRRSSRRHCEKRRRMRMMLKSRLYEATGFLTEAGIRLWVQWTGKRVSRESAAWLQCPMGSRGRIGQEFYAHLAQREGLRIEASDHAGLLDDFNNL